MSIKEIIYKIGTIGNPELLWLIKQSMYLNLDFIWMRSGRCLKGKTMRPFTTNWKRRKDTVKLLSKISNHVSQDPLETLSNKAR